MDAGVTGSSSEPRLTFRPDIEGLRAVAVALVVVLHAGVNTVSGGYIGVDVFFVISGFLITSLLIDEVRATERVSLLSFYARRARRILPAASFVIAATVIASYLQLGPVAGRTSAIDGQWAAGFAANVRFIRQGTNYFAIGLPPSPLQHYWSLAVEEQFYLVWPTVLFALVLFGRRFSKSTLTLQLGLAAIAGGSLYWSVHQTAVAPTTAYFSPFTRAWELAAGALVAVFSIAVLHAPAVLRTLARWVGLAFILLAAFAFTATTPFPGSAALLPVAGTALVVAGGIGRPRGSAGLVLGLPPMRWLGKISFSVYLWHWPVLIIEEERSATPLSNVARVVCVVITLALSVASYYAIERPLRSVEAVKGTGTRTAWERSRKAVLVGAVAIMVAVAASVYTNNRAVSAIDNAASGTAGVSGAVGSSLTTAPSATPAEAVADLQARVRTLVQHGLVLRAVPPDVDPPVLRAPLDHRFTRCLQPRSQVRVTTCAFGDVTSRRILVVFGDSHAMTWMPALDTYGSQAGYRVLTVQKLACPVPSLTEYMLGGPYTQCTTWRANALRYIRTLKPAVVVIAFGLENVLLGRVPNLPLWSSGLRTSMRALTASGAHVVEIGNNAQLSQDPGLCLSRPHADPSTCTGTFSRQGSVDAERAVVRSFGATFIDIEPWYCVDARCPLIIDNRIAYADSDHLAPHYVSDLEPLLAASLRSAGLR